MRTLPRPTLIRCLPRNLHAMLRCECGCPGRAALLAAEPAQRNRCRVLHRSRAVRSAFASILARDRATAASGCAADLGIGTAFVGFGSSSRIGSASVSGGREPAAADLIGLGQNLGEGVRPLARSCVGLASEQRTRDTGRLLRVSDLRQQLHRPRWPSKHQSPVPAAMAPSLPRWRIA